MEPAIVAENRPTTLNTNETPIPNPLTLYQGLKENVQTGKNLDSDKFLTDLSNLNSTGVIDKQPLLKDKLLEWGQNPVVLFAVYIKIRDSIQKEDQNQVRDGLQLAHILGMDRNSPDPRRQLAVDQIRKWQKTYTQEIKSTKPKRKFGLKARLALSAATTIAGVQGVPEANVASFFAAPIVGVTSIFEGKLDQAGYKIEIPAQLPRLTSQQQELQESIHEHSMDFIFTTTINTPEGERSISVSMPFAESNYGYGGSGRISVTQGKQLQKMAEGNKQVWQDSILKKVKEYKQAEQNYEQYVQKETKSGRTPMDQDKFLRTYQGYDENTIFIWNIKDPYERAFYERLREARVFTDCSGAVYNFLRYAYDKTHGSGRFDRYIQATTGWNMNLFSADRWFDRRISDVLGTPPVKDLLPGDIIGLKDANGKIGQHSMVVEGWEQIDNQTYLSLWQATDESEDHGVFKYKVKVTQDTENLPLHKQQWRTEEEKEPKIATQTTLGEGLGGQSYLNRLAHIDSQGDDVVTYLVARLKVFEQK